MVMKSRAHFLVIFLWSTFLCAGGVPSKAGGAPTPGGAAVLPGAEAPAYAAAIVAPPPTKVAAPAHAGEFAIPAGGAGAGAPMTLQVVVQGGSAHAAPVVTADARAATQTTVTTLVSNVSQSISEAAQNLQALLQQHNIPSNSGEWGGFFRAHKKGVIIGSVVITYATLCAVLVSGNRYCARDDLWARWQPLMSIKELQKLAQAELQKKLCEDILKAYLLKEKSRIGAYLRFMKDVEKEERRLAQHITLCTWLQRMPFSRFLPISDEKLKRARSLKKRLAFIKHIFISWSAQQDF